MWIAGRALLGVAESGGRAIESRDSLEKGEDRLALNGVMEMASHRITFAIKPLAPIEPGTSPDQTHLPPE
jgi:hypothetical protein